MHVATIRHEAQVGGSNDEELVDLARQGEEGAIRALIKRHNQRLFRVARSVVRDDAEAEDIVQETYVRAFTRLNSFRGDSLFSTWLIRIALNEALGRTRRKRPTTEFEKLDALNTDPSEGGVIMFPTFTAPVASDAELARKQIREFLEKAVDDLPEDFRIVFMLRDIEDMSTEETASQLSLKPETVKTRLHRARRLMRAAIEKRLSPTFSGLFPFDGARCDRMADRVVARLRDTGAR